MGKLYWRCLVRRIGVGGVVGMTLLLASACSSEDESSIEPTLSSLWQNHFKNCAENCHSPGGDERDGPNMRTEASFYNDLVGQSMADYINWSRDTGCNDLKFIAANSANTSLLVAAMIASESDALIAAQGRGCTTAINVHEVNRFTITNQELAQALQDWINNGAVAN